MGSGSQRYPRVNIVSTDYGRYGTSVYQRLYSRKEGENGFGANSHIYRKENVGGCKNKVVSPTSTRNDASSGSLIKTDTAGSMCSTTTAGQNEGTAVDESRLDVIDSSGDVSSKGSKIRRKYKSLISSSSKKLINKLHEHGSSDTFSLFSLRTTQSHKHDRLKSEHAIIELRDPPDAKFEALPVEVVANVLRMLEGSDQRNLVNCLYVSKRFYEAAKMVLYSSPKFTSTYRVAQFVTSLRLYPENGKYVRVLDLSQLKNGLIVEESHSEEDEGSLRHSLTDSSLDDTFEYAFAGWRDWRHRHDPLYGATALNSYNLKRIASRSSSISSQTPPTSLSPNFGNPHNSTSNSVSPRARGHRSNSSVSSFTSSIMSSLQNNSHISLVTTSSTSNSAGQLESPEPGGSISRRKSSNGEAVHANTKPKIKDENSIRRSLWYKLKFGSKSARSMNQKRNSKLLNHVQEDKSVEFRRKGTTVRFGGIQPFRTGHPYTNKFLLKYAPYRDLPIGHIMHLLKLCPNITSLDLSHLVFCPDFEIINKEPSKVLKCSSLLPAVQESVEIPAKEESELHVVYVTDSNKNPDYYNKVSRVRSSAQGPVDFLTGCGTRDDDPPPIDAQTRSRSSARQNLNHGVTLRKLNPAEIFGYLCDHQLATSLKHVKMEDIVWCRQNMIKYIILKSFKRGDKGNINFSFARAGLNMNLAWTCDGDLNDFVSLLVMDHINQMDEFSLRELFSVLAKPSTADNITFPDPEIIEISRVFTIEYSIDPDRQDKLDFRACIIRTERPTSYRIRRLSPNYISLAVDLCAESGVSDMTQPTETMSESLKRLHQLTHQITNKLRDLRNVDLRRNIGQNAFSAENVF